MVATLVGPGDGHDARIGCWIIHDSRLRNITGSRDNKNVGALGGRDRCA
jgi:hypothetical protein